MEYVVVILLILLVISLIANYMYSEDEEDMEEEYDLMNELDSKVDKYIANYEQFIKDYGDKTLNEIINEIGYQELANTIACYDIAMMLKDDETDID